MDQEYDLAHLAEDLGKELPDITELYLFGSRARGTKSTRSDADVLVVSSNYVQPKVLRDFSANNCDALDLFTVDGGKAISTQNESFIESADFSSLVEKLGAIKIWSRESGREAADIQWRFTVKEGVEFIPSVLPNQPKVDNGTNANIIDLSKITLVQILTALTVPQFVAVFAALCVVIGASFTAGIQYEKITTEKPKIVQPSALRKEQADLIAKANKENTNLINSINNYVDYRDTKGGGIDSEANIYNGDVDKAVGNLSSIISSIKAKFSNNAVKGIPAYLKEINKHINEPKVKTVSSNTAFVVEWEKVKSDLYTEAKSDLK
ncbi:nucleotidyltransferase domain-containing protein [Marinobacterium sp. YM272]|uniref:nucleotidyltransferase domain-containing protein n=1 Tax=Marinobacterium sp. YM272 TaxID=3421654 RepID=UPI003D7FBA9C